MRGASRRWCPTPEQVMLLEELYRRGLRTPTAAQIQKITGQLSLYGKIQGKNVFYWFQNHKARDRQKLRALQHHLFYPFHFHTPFQGTGVFEDGAMRQIWRLDPQNDCSMRRNGHDCSHVGTTKPLETLELFPLTSAYHQQTPSSSFSINN